MPGWWNGIHATLKMLWSKGHVGSIPAPGTKYEVKSSTKKAPKML